MGFLEPLPHSHRFSPGKILRGDHRDQISILSYKALFTFLTNIFYFLYFRVSADGNCLYAACSLFLIHTEELATLLRVLTSLELYINAEKYTSSHLVFQAAVQEGKCYQKAINAFWASLEEKYVRYGKAEVQCVRMNASMIIESYVYVSFIAVLGLASVISTPIRLFSFKFKGKFHLWFHHLTNRMILPRIESGAEPMQLFWTCQNKLCDKLDHFVPLLPINVIPGKEAVTMVNQFDGEDIFDYKVMSAICIEIGVKRKAGIFSCSCQKKEGPKVKNKNTHNTSHISIHFSIYTRSCSRFQVKIFSHCNFSTSTQCVWKI